MKTLILARAAKDSDRVEFRRWLLTDYAPRKLAVLEGASRVVLLLADIGSPLTGDFADKNYDPLYDAIIEIWSAASHAVNALAQDRDLSDRATLDVRPSEETICKDLNGPPPVGRTPGVAMMAFCKPIPGMKREETLRHYTEHRPLAVQVHAGMDRYVQHVFPDEPSRDPYFFGVSHLHFPDFDRVMEGLFQKPEDVAFIMADVAEFIAESPSVSATEYVLKA